MNNSDKDYRKLGGWLMIIFIIALLNAVGDVYALIWGLTHTSAVGGLFLNAYFFGIYASRSLLLIFTPLTLLCTVLCLVFMAMRKLNPFKIFFVAACSIGLASLIANLIAISPATFFDIMIAAYGGTFIADMIQPMMGIFRMMYLPTIITGVLGAIGVIVICMIYFKRSKRVAEWFRV